jgi:hypothetical protein
LVNQLSIEKTELGKKVIEIASFLKSKCLIKNKKLRGIQFPVGIKSSLALALIPITESPKIPVKRMVTKKLAASYCCWKIIV